MALPAGITTCVVSAGAPLDFAGVGGTINLTITPILGGNANNITWSATGQPLVAFSMSATADAGTAAQVVVPHVDQPGFINGSGDAATGWSYRASITFTGANRQKITWTKNFQVLQGQTSIDLDLVPDGSITSPTSAPLPAVLSVNGQTGEVTTDSLPDTTGATSGDVATYDGTTVGWAPGTSDADISALVTDPGTDTGAALVGSYTGKGGATKTDGQNVKHLRRPTLTVEKWWPNEFGDHQIMWVDETLKIAYSIGLDNRLRKSTWTAAQGEALRWSTQLSAAADGFRWCDNGVFLRLPDTGTLLMEQVAVADNQTTLLRSTDDGTTWATVWTAPVASVRFLGPQSVVRDDNTGYLYITEYTTDLSITEIHLWQSTDDGATWTIWNTMTRAETGPGTIRHWHSARYDSASQRMFFLAGDTNEDAGIYRLNDTGDGIELVCKHADISEQVGLPNPARGVDLMLFPDHIAWATDGAGGQNCVIRMDRAQIGIHPPTVERIADIDSTGWYAQRAADDGSRWVFATATEESVSWVADKGISHLYAVSDEASHVDELAAAAMDGNVLGFATISGLGGASGGGEAFWMRAHRYQTPYSYGVVTYTSMSAFQFRARLGNAVVPLIKPPPRKPTYNKETHSCGPVVVAASTTVPWGGTRVPRRCTKLVIHNFGARALVGPFTAAKVEVWNKTTSTELTEWPGQSYLYDGKADTDIAALAYNVTDADQIEFRLTNTTTGEITASAFVAFSWSF